MELDKLGCTNCVKLESNLQLRKKDNNLKKVGLKSHYTRNPGILRGKCILEHCDISQVCIKHLDFMINLKRGDGLLSFTAWKSCAPALNSYIYIQLG